jgi:hypothetical protein
MVGAWPGQAQTNAPPAVYVRSYVNDVPNQPLITVTVTGAVNVASLTIEETLPGAASALSVSGDGVYLPALNAIRWGPYFNTVATNVSYRITGLPASYPVNGGSWMDGHWYFSPGATLVTVLPAAGGSTGVPSAPPQVATPAFSPPSGASVPVSVTITDATPGAVIYYTLNGSLPTQGSTLYTGAVALASASVLRAAAFTNGWTPSIAAAAFYGPLASPVNAQVTRSVSGNGTAAPVVTFNVTPGTNANCIAITETLAPGIGATSISSGGNYVASNNVVLWGPFFGTSGFSLSYQAVGLPGAYPGKVSWSVDGVSGSETTGTNLVIAGNGVNGTIPTQPPQVPPPIFVPPSGSAVPVDVLIGLPGWDFTLLDDTWAGGTRSLQNLPAQSAWFVSGSSTNLTAGVNALNFWNGTNAVAGITYFTPNATTPVSLGIGDTLKATLKLVLTKVAPTNTAQGLRIGLFDFVDSSLSPPRASSDGFAAAGQGAGVQGYCLFQNLGTNFLGATPVDVRVRTNILSGSLLATNTDFRSLTGTVVSNNFPGFTAGRQYVLTLTVNRTAVGSLAFSASWLDTTTGGTFSKSATNASAASFRFDGLALWCQAAASTATNITLSEFKMDYIPQATNSAPSAASTAIYYTLDGSLPTQSSTLYTGAVQLASAGVVRAVAFATGWAPSVPSVAFYGSLASPANVQVTRSVSGNGSAAPVVTFNVTPGTNANCIAITESLAPGIGATSISSGGIYVASNNVVLWGPFFGTSGFSLSYQAVGLPGAYPAKVSWSVDGVSGSETTGTNLVIAGSGVNGTIPTPTPQVQTPVLTPAMASNLPVAVTITDATPGAVIYYTLDGSLPTQSSTLYTGAVSLVSASVLRAVAFTNGWAPSGAALGEYVPPITTNTVSVAHSVSGNGDFMPTVSLTATPQGVVNCYAVIETIPFGAAPSGLSGDGVWDPLASVIRWGPYLDNQPRVFSYNVRGASGSYPLSGQVSVNGYSMATDATNVLVNANSTGSAPVNNLSACTSAYFSYNVDINPAPGVVTVTSASGTVTWGDGTQSLFTQPVTTLLKLYTSAGTYPIVIAANWTGTAPGLAVSGFATRTDLVQVVTSCGGLQIVTQPSNQEALVGGSVQFTVSASGSLPITYRWYFNTNTALFSPSSNASLSLSNITPQSAGWYSVVITNASGSVTSSFASLTVVSPLVTGLVRGTDGKVTLTFVGLPNVTTRIWATTNVGLPASWQPIFTNTTTAANGTWQFIDAKATNYPARFYRFSTP